MTHRNERSSWNTVVTLGAALLFTACTSFSVRTPDRGMDGPQGPGVDAERPRTSSPTLDTREQCRSAGRTAGWIAVTYLRLGEECSRVDDNPYNGVLLQKYRDQPVGTVMDICADQVVPRGWIEIAEPSDMACRGAVVDEGDPTSIRIRRVEGTVRR